MKRTFYEIGISDEQISACDISQIRDAFDEIVSVPRAAKRLRGNVMFAFGRFDNDPRSNYAIEEVRRYTQIIDEAYPFFPYFLPPEPQATQMYSWFLSLARPTSPLPQDGKEIEVNLRELSLLVLDRLRAVRHFCNCIFDDPADIETAILGVMPPEVAEAVRPALGP